MEQSQFPVKRFARFDDLGKTHGFAHVQMKRLPHNTCRKKGHFAKDTFAVGSLNNYLGEL